MKFAIRVLNQYGEDPRSVYDTLSKRFNEVEVHEETKPYLHYHCLIEAVRMNEKQVREIIRKMPKAHKLVRSRNNLDVQQCQNIPKYREYMNKQHGRSYDYNDSNIEAVNAIRSDAELEAEMMFASAYIHPHSIECAFTD